MIKTVDVKKVRSRSRWYCECWCGKKFDFYTEYTPWFWPELHHIYRRSEYRKKDRDQERNLALLYWPCHKSIHNWNFNLDKVLKQEADERKPKKERTEDKVKRWSDDKTKALAKQQREKALDYYKKTHWWLSPDQFKRKKEKSFMNSLRRW